MGYLTTEVTEVTEGTEVTEVTGCGCVFWQTGDLAASPAMAIKSSEQAMEVRWKRAMALAFSKILASDNLT